MVVLIMLLMVMVFVIVTQVHLTKDWFILILTIIDNYLRLVLSSLPAVVLILGILIIFRHRLVVDRLIDRIVKLPGGTELDSLTQKKEEESIEKIKEENKKLKGEVLEKAKERLFERIYSFIYGSQLDILIKINTIKNRQMSLSEAMQIYINASIKYPSLKNYKFEDYLLFLENNGLIKRINSGGTISLEITELSKEFLNYLVTQNLLLIINKPF